MSMYITIGNSVGSLSNAVSGGGGGVSDIDNVYSMEFDGVDDYVDCGNISAFGNVTKASFSFWLNRTTTTPGQIFGINVSSYNRIGCLIQSDDIKFYLNGVAAQINNFITIDGWYHIAIVYDYSESVNADRIKIYLNGSPTSCGGTVASSFPALDANLKLGTFTTSFLTGNLDEFAGFANVALSEPEIIDIYNATSTGKTADLSTTTTPPVVWYRMGD